MASLADRLPQTADFTEKVSQTIGALDQAREMVKVVDTSSVVELGSRVASVAIPQAADWIAPLTDGLHRIASVSPPGGSEVLADLMQDLKTGSEPFAGPLKAQLTTLAGSLEPIIGLMDKMGMVEDLFGQVLPKITGIKDRIAGEGGDFGALLGKLMEIMNEIPAIDNIPMAVELKMVLSRLHTLLAQDGAALSGFFTETVNNLAVGLGESFDTPLQAALTRAQAVGSGLSVGNIKDHLGEMEGRFNELQALDTSSIEGIRAAIQKVNRVRTDTEGIAAQIRIYVDTTQTALSNLGLNDLRLALEEAIFSVAEAVRRGESEGVIGKLLRQIRRYIQHMDLDGITDSICTQLEKARESLDALDWSSVQQPLQEALEGLNGSLDSLEQSTIKTTIQIGMALEEVGEVVDELDTEAVLQVIQEGGQRATETAQDIIDGVANIIGQLTTLISDLTTQVGQVNLVTIKQELEDLLGELKEVLEGPDVQQVLDSMEDAIEQIEEGMSGITFTPVFNQVNSEIDTQKDKLAKVDLSSLNPILLGLLKAAVEVLKQFDLAGAITQELFEQFSEITDIPKVSIEPISQGFKVISNHVAQFDPAGIAVAPLIPPIEKAKTMIEQLSPTTLLAPVEQASEEVTDRLANLDAAVLLGPVKELHGKVITVMDSLDPSQLTDILRQGLGAVADQLDHLPLKDLSEKLTSFSQRFSALVEQFPEEADPIQALDIAVNLKQFLDKLDPNAFSEAATQFIGKFTANLEQVDLETLRPAFNALAEAVSAFQGRFIDSSITETLKGAARGLSETDHMSVLSRAQNVWSQARRAIESSPIPSGGEADRTALLTAMNETAPMTLLNTTMGKLTGMSRTMEIMASESQDLFQELDFMAGNLQESLQTWMHTDIDHATLKALLEPTLHKMLVAPLEDIIQDLVQRKAGWEALLEAFDDFSNEFRTRLLGFMTIPAMLKEMLETVTGISDRIRNLDLSAISQGLQGSYGTIRQKVADLDPVAIEAEVQNVVQSLSDSLAGLYPKEEVKALDAMFQQQIIGPLTDWDPERLIGEPLQAVMEKINEALERLDVERILEALVRCMARLEEELKTGLTGTGRAFNNLLAASPV